MNITVIKYRHVEDEGTDHDNVILVQEGDDKLQVMADYFNAALNIEEVAPAETLTPENVEELLQSAYGYLIEYEDYDLTPQPVTMGMGATPEIRQAFDYQCGCFKHEPHCKSMVAVLTAAGYNVLFENSGDGFRIYVRELAGYFWPENDTEDRWNHCI